MTAKTIAKPINKLLIDMLKEEKITKHIPSKDQKLGW